MKKHLLIILSAILFMPMFAQIGDIHIALAINKECTLDENAKHLLIGKLQQLLSRNGVSGIEYGAVVIIPEVAEANSKIINGGMKNISSVELNITLKVQHLITGTVFNTVSITANGEGYSAKEAEQRAINKINVMKPEYAEFIKESKSRIYNYYTSNTNVITAKAESLATQQKFDEALALLSTYPENLPGYASVTAAINSIFNKARTLYCSQLLLSAQSAYSNEDYDTAAEIISMIDAQSSCTAEAKVLLRKIEQKRNRQYNDNLAIQKEQMRAEERITTAKITAVKDIATAYYKQRQNYIFFW